jgi:hypothetical protein
MATTYTLIKGETLAGSQASYTFSAIPSTYTDLCIKYSLRGSDSLTQSNLRISFNSDVTGYGTTNLNGDGSAAASQRSTSAANMSHRAGMDAAGATASTFANGEIYIPNYAGSTAKPVSFFSGQETNAATTAYVSATAGLSTVTTAAITSIILTPSVGNFLTDSSFYLYGIKNS